VDTINQKTTVQFPLTSKDLGQFLAVFECFTSAGHNLRLVDRKTGETVVKIER
jgi:hypothetical protein